MITRLRSFRALDELLSLKRPDVRVAKDQVYHFAGVKSFGAGVFRSASRMGSEFAYRKLIRINSGQFVYPKLMAWEGALGVVPPDLDGLVVSPEFCVFDINHDLVIPAWLDLYFRQPAIWASLAGGSAGTNVRRRRIYPQDFLKIRVPVPGLDYQLAVCNAATALEERVSQVLSSRNASVLRLDNAVKEFEYKLWPDASIKHAPTLVDVTSFLGRGRQSLQGTSEHFLIKSQHVQMGRYIRSWMTLAPEAASKVNPAARAQVGDTLIACSAAGCLGRVARFDTPGVEASTDTHVAIARARPEIVLPDYLYAYLRGAQGQIQLRSRERGDWTKEKVSFRLTELNLSDLRQVPVPVPSLETQVRIVNQLQEFRTKIERLRVLQIEQLALVRAIGPAAVGHALRSAQIQCSSGLDAEQAR